MSYSEEPPRGFDRPSPGDYSQPRRRTLGSLAKKAKEKNLKNAIVMMILAAVVLILSGLVEYFTLEDQIDQAIEKEVQQAGRGVQVDPAWKAEVKEKALKIARAYCYGVLGLGTLYIIFAMFVKKFPIPITILALVIFVCFLLAQAVLVWETPEVIFHGFLWKVIIIVGLAGSIKPAIAYQRAKEEEELAASGDDAEVVEDNA